MEVNKKRLSEIFGVSVRTIQNWQDQGMPVARGGGKGNEVLYESSAARGTLYFAGQGIQQQWKMKRDMLSPRYTTRLSDLLQVR